MRYLLIAIAMVAAGCGPRADGPAAGPERTSGKETATASVEGRRLRLTPELQKKWAITTAEVSPVTLTSTVSLPGVLGVNQNRTAHISALLEGPVVSVNADLGQQVHRGQTLLVVHSPAFAQAKSAFFEAYARLNLARTESERARALLSGEAIQQREVVRRDADYKAASAQYGVAESNLHSFGLSQDDIEALLKRYRSNGDDTRVDDVTEPYLNVKSPVDGRVIFRDVIVGEHVHADKVLMTVSDLGTLWAVLDAREADLPSVHPGGAVTIRSTVYRDRTFEGRIEQVGDVVDEKLRTIKVRVEVRNTGLMLKPNMYIDGVIENVVASRKVLAVPDEAVQTIDGEPVVFVRQEGNLFAMRPVQLGERVGDSRAILKGLAPNEVVVVNGAFTLKAELLKGTFGEDE
jgi:cobalt-zinc-cadmium efflux system membrane fusion protein